MRLGAVVDAVPIGLVRQRGVEAEAGMVAQGLPAQDDCMKPARLVVLGYGAVVSVGVLRDEGLPYADALVQVALVAREAALGA